MKDIKASTIWTICIGVCLIILAGGWAAVSYQNAALAPISERFFQIAEKILLLAGGGAGVIAGGKLQGKKPDGN